MTSPEPQPLPSRARQTFLAFLMAALAVGLYARTSQFSFVDYDDYDYVTRNPVVEQGLTQRGLELAIQGGHSSNWHPLTTLSHLVDVELYGADEDSSAGGHHATNIFLHALNAALCLLALLALTRRTDLALLVAALFALHPQHVESVAWISERKDLLSGTFFFLTLLAWERYGRLGGKGNYLMAAAALVLGLLSKQMLVTLPLLLVLLDIWPLGRLGDSSSGARVKSLGGLLLEKLPLFLFSVLSIIPMWMAQSDAGTLGKLSLGVRLENALASIYHYVAQMFWPVDLAVFYPHPALVGGSMTVAAVLGAALVVLCSLWSLKQLRSCPRFGVGWFWFLGMLVPVIGLVQVGSQAYADRYTYLPSIGLYLLVGGASLDWARARPSAKRLVQAAWVLVIGVLFGVSWRQVGTWENSKTLNKHALEVTENNYVAHNNYGLYFLEKTSDPILAAEHFQAALLIRSNFLQAAENLASSYTAQQRVKDAIAIYDNILRQQPDNARVLARLGQLNAAKGDSQAAFNLLEKSVQLDPSSASNWTELGFLRLQRSEGIFAEQCAVKALALDPSNTRAHILHARAARMLGYAEAAVTRAQAAVDSDPTSVEAYLTQCRILADQGRLVEAEEVCEKLLDVDKYNVQGSILRGKFLMLRHKAEQMNAQQSGQEVPEKTTFLAQAEEQLASALGEAPNNPEALEFYGMLLIEEGSFEQAEEQFLAALQVRPDYPSALTNLGSLYETMGQEGKALAQYRRLMETASDAPTARIVARSMAWILATSPDDALLDGEEALRMASFAIRSFRDLGINEAATFEAAAAAYARAERWEDAVKHQEVAVKLAQNATQSSGSSKRLKLYNSKQAFQRAKP